MIDTIVQGNCLDVMAGMGDGIFQTCITSPPYWGLRDYGLEPIVWDGDPDCEHEWGEERIVKAEGLAGSGVGKIHIGSSYSPRKENLILKYNASQGSVCHKCGAWLGSLGLEPTPELYIDHLVQIFREVKRVLRDDGTCWINIADSYWGGKGQSSSQGDTHQEGRFERGESLSRGYQTMGGAKQTRPSDGRHHTIKPKDMVLIPFRLALALQADGWWIRSDIIWHKPSCMPSSVKDRPTADFEHVFLLAKSKHYFYDNVAIMEPIQESTIERSKYGWNGKTGLASEVGGRAGNMWTRASKEEGMNCYNPAGRNKRAVWSINPKPYAEAHFATFPPKLVEPMILAGSSNKTCEHCGAAWVRVVAKESNWKERKEAGAISGNREPRNVENNALYGEGMVKRVGYSSNKTTGFEPSCDCENNTGSGASTVLDCFAGSCTTGAVAKEKGRHYVMIEQSPDYVKLGEKRIADAVYQPELF